MATTTATVSLSMEESSSDDAHIHNKSNVRFSIDHYANQYRINKNRKSQHKASHPSHENKKRRTSLTKQQEVIRMRRIGKFFAIFLPLFYGMYAYYSLLYIIPQLPFLVIFQTESNPQKLVIFRILFGTFVIILIFLWYWAYFKAKYSHPGPIPNAWSQWNGNPMTRPPDPIYAVNHSLSGSSMIITKYSRLYCSKCNVFRPYRTGHCKRCNICVTRIDHHCYFINNCVGSNNQRYFIQLLVYSAMSWILYILCAPFSKQNMIENIFEGIQWNLTIFMIFSVLPTLGAVGLIGVMFLMFGQMQSIVKNQTFTELKFHNDEITNKKTPCCRNLIKKMKEGYERGRNKRNKYRAKNEEESKELVRNDMNDMEEKDESEEANQVNRNEPLEQYDLGSKWKNVETVFGSSAIHWFIPLDWTEDELYKRMLTRPFSFDFLPSFLS